ncbi:MAG: phosphoribosylamine--glycine ligase, partial [Ignavibacteriae bacterium]|nr:phosphoribosylamine--glycine ligase [Ignavibacteriota bacterium]
ASSPLPVVLKADGLASGKGVIVCTEKEQAITAVHEMMEQHAFGTAGNTLVVEEFLEGQEASVFALCDGRDFITLAPAQDHKRALDDDQGKNTGGMGAYAPAPVVTDDILQTVEQEIIRPTMEGMAADGAPFTGCLYVGLMVTASGPKVVEFNCRFGDPETQVVLPLFDGNIVELFVASCSGGIAEYRNLDRMKTRRGAAVCVVLASQGYPDKYSVGHPIRGLDAVARLDNITVFHAGTRLDGGTLLTAGGRVLAVTAVRRDGSLGRAIDDVYQAVDRISFEGMHFRRDIGRKAMAY